MDILGQTSIQSILFFILYGITFVVPLLAAFYLLLRRGNAIAKGVTPPVRLRRWTAAFFAVASLAHVWWLLFYIYSGDQYSAASMVLALLDCVLLFTTFAGMLLSMLQDRRRPIWPVLVGLIPIVVLGGAFVVYPSQLTEQITVAYLVLLGLLFAAYMAFSIHLYGRWLNDNYADLENKRVWLCQAVALGSMAMFILYVFASEMVFIWLIHIIELVFVGLLLWRVETLPRLETQTKEPSAPLASRREDGGEAPINIDLALIEQLLAEHCVATQLYLQHDLTLQQLAQAVGTNRSYLSQY